MPLAPGLAIRTLIRPGGRATLVVVRRSRKSGPPAPAPVAERRILLARTEENADRSAPVPRPAGAAAGFSRPVARALAALGTRACPLGRDGVALDGRQAPLAHVVAEANRCLAAAGRPPIAYPGVRPKEGR